MENGGPEYAVELPHGYTYSAHPVACAAALASLDIIEQDGLIDCVRELSPVFETALHSLAGTRYVADIRNYGFAGGLSIEHASGEPILRPYQIAMKMWDKGYYVRYGGDTIQLGLPFTTRREEIDSLINALGDTIKELT